MKEDEMQVVWERAGRAVRAGKQRAHWLLDDLVIVHVSGEETDGRYSLVEFLMPPGDMTPLHVHRRDSQTTYVLEGEVTFYRPASRACAGAGTASTSRPAFPKPSASPPRRRRGCWT
jgi:mannose-6-phosphate isomerase-like protein (cupin superfamily)